MTTARESIDKSRREWITRRPPPTPAYHEKGQAEKAGERESDRSGQPDEREDGSTEARG